MVTPAKKRVQESTKRAATKKAAKTTKAAKARTPGGKAAGS